MNPRTSSSVDEVRTRQVTWTDPMVALQRFVGMSREEFLAEFTSGGIPKPPIGELLGFEVLEAEPGRAVLAFPTAEYLCNPFGVVAGGVAATIMDAAMWVAFQTSLPGQTLVSTTDLNVHYVRHIPMSIGEVRVQAQAVHVGRMTGTAESRAVDGEGTLYAHATAGFVAAVDPTVNGSA